jgi:hypothetical protein
LLVLVAVPRLAFAQPVDKDVIDPSELPPPTLTVDDVAPPFGAPGEVAISGATSIGAGYARYSGDQTSSASLWFEPSVDVFVVPNLSLGASISLGYGDQHGYGADGSLIETTTTTLSAALRIGYNVPIAPVLSFWPRALVGYDWDRQDQTANEGSISVTNPLGAATSTFDGAWGELLLPLTLHPSPHLFASFGPSIVRDFSAPQGGNGNGERTQLGAWLDVGGWFGGRPANDRDDPQLAPAPRFGARHDFVITNAIVLNGFSTSYSGITSSNKSVRIEPGLDFFVAEHVSVGLAVAVDYWNDTGIDPTTGAAVSSLLHAYSVAPRAGYDFPIAAHVSFWPELFVGVGKSSGGESENTSSNPNDEVYVWIGLSAPVLVHLASHFFVGLGPDVTQDLSRSYSYGTASVQYRETNVGVGSVVGGTF